MKKQKNILALIVMLVFLGLGIYFILITSLTKTSSGSYVTGYSYQIPENDTLFGGLFNSPDIDNSLSHKDYVKKLNEFENSRREWNLQNEGNVFSGWSIGNTGFYSAPRMSERLKTSGNSNNIVLYLDSLLVKKAKTIEPEKIKSIQKEIEQITDSVQNSGNNTFNQMKLINQLYYIGIKEYSLKDHYSKFFILNDSNYYLAIIKVDSTKKQNDEEINYAHYTRKQIPFRYSSNNKMLYFPVSKKVHSFFNFFIYPLACICLIFFSYYLIGLPLQVLWNISKNRVFTYSTINNLKRISIAILIYTLWNLTFPYIIHLCFINKIPDDFSFISFFQIIKQNFAPIALTLIIFAIRYSFTKGFKLQQEQDLTI